MSTVTKKQIDDVKDKVTKENTRLHRQVHTIASFRLFLICSYFTPIEPSSGHLKCINFVYINFREFHEFQSILQRLILKNFHLMGHSQKLILASFLLKHLIRKSLKTLRKLENISDISFCRKSLNFLIYLHLNSHIFYFTSISVKIHEKLIK